MSDFNTQKTKIGLVMEGGAMRGMFTAGVMDVLMENNIRFDGAIGTSAGAVFGCNYKSKQIGRVIRYNKRFCRDKRYCSLRSWLKTGDFYNVEFDYVTLPQELDIFDVDTFSQNPMEFYVVATSAQSGKAFYQKLPNGDSYDLLWMRASSAMPILSRLVEIDGEKYSDGGAADSIPIQYFESIGYGKNVVILTQPHGFVKKKNKLMPLLKSVLRKYPNLLRTLENRHIGYNETLAYIEKAEKEGRAFVIRPPKPLNIGAREKDPENLERVYQLGRAEAEKQLLSLLRFLA